tara:strand:+ start:2151 stop:3164 length:1014 start_codon:yes stop_codon:yes gene_type:complete
MDFLKECAKRLNTETAEDVLKDMRERYTTVRCLRVKTGLVRKFFDGPDAIEFTKALENTLSKYKDQHEKIEWIKSITDREEGKGPWYGIKSLKDPVFPDIAQELKGLPRRLPKNVWNLCVTKDELKECKRMATNVKLKSNSKRLKVNAMNILNHCRNVVDEYEKYTMYELSLAIIFLTGRRTCEIMNGKSTFERKEGDFIASFGGQAKKKDSTVYKIPLLHNFSSITRALKHLRELQGKIPDENSKVTSRYASGLRQFLLSSNIFKEVLKIHNLRKTYACLCLKLFEWGDPSDLYICMHILGHNDITEPIVYNVIDVGNVDNAERLGIGPDIPSFSL